MTGNDEQPEPDLRALVAAMVDRRDPDLSEGAPNFELPDAQDRSLHVSYPFALDRPNSDGRWNVVLAATLVVDRDGIEPACHGEPNHGKRMAVTDIGYRIAVR